MSMILLAAALLATPTADCDGATTRAVEACLTERLGATDAELNRYYAAAVRRLKAESGNDVLLQLRRSETAWIAHRDAECGAVRAWWAPGTIAGSAATTCRIRVTEARTLVIWRNWLTYAHSTPPILPRPIIGD